MDDVAVRDLQDPAAVEYHRAYPRESKAVLIAKVKGERRSSSSHLIET